MSRHAHDHTRVRSCRPNPTVCDSADEALGALSDSGPSSPAARPTWVPGQTRWRLTAKGEAAVRDWRRKHSGARGGA
jgi:hypothetical protein